MDPDKVNAYMNGFIADGCDPETERFIRDFLIKMEFGHFDYDEESEHYDPYA